MQPHMGTEGLPDRLDACVGYAVLSEVHGTQFFFHFDTFGEGIYQFVVKIVLTEV